MIYLFGCYTALRYSDYSNIKPVNIIEIEGEFFFKMITQKTKQLVIIPVNPITLELFEKYKDSHNKLLKSMSDVKFNKHLKEVAQLVGFTSTGRVAETPDKQLWELIASHTARRSFATNYYLQGFPAIDLMADWLEGLFKKHQSCCMPRCCRPLFYLILLQKNKRS